MFLRKADYNGIIQEDELDLILEDKNDVVNNNFLFDNEAAALTEVQSYLRHLYDVALIFTGVSKWLAATNFVIDDVIYYEPDNLTYKALTIHTNKIPPDEAADWVVIADPRDAQLKNYVIDVTLYHLHSRINPRNIPELRLARRDEAVKWLKMISKGEITVNLALIDDTSQSGFRIAFGGETKIKNNY